MQYPQDQQSNQTQGRERGGKAFHGRSIPTTARNAKPYPNDPQWLQLSRKLPPDVVIAALLRFGFRVTDIADRFDVSPCRISAVARRMGFPPIPNGSTLYRSNGAPLSRWERLAAA